MEWLLEELGLSKHGIILLGLWPLGSHCDKFLIRNPEYFYHYFILRPQQPQLIWCEATRGRLLFM